MIEELKEQMSRDLNLFRFKKETAREYNQRLIYSGLATWVRTLICGNPLSDMSADVDGKFPDIMYVQSNLAKVAGAFFQSLEIDESWIEVEEGQDKANVLAGEIIQSMIYQNEIAEVNSRLLAPVPVRKCLYDDWIHMYGNDTYDRGCMTIGLSQWVNTMVNDAEKPEQVISIKGADYVRHIMDNFEWKEAVLQGEYDIFTVGSERLYAKAWRAFDERKVTEGLYLLRDAGSYEPGYMLFRKEGNIEKISSLDPWYIESQEVYRIMYALNYNNGTPAKFRIKDMEDSFILFYPSWLPEAENKLFLSLSWPYNTYQDKIVRVFPEQVKGLILSVIDNLGGYISK